jgi:hypothetical protein
MTLVTVTGRLADLFRRTATSRSAVALVAANAIPLAGVLLFGWSLWTILVLYWLENGIVGFWTIARILTARGSILPGPAELARLAPLGGGGQRAALGELQSALDASGQAGALEPRGLPVIGRLGIAAFFAFHYGLFWLVHGVFVFALPSFLGIGSTPPLDVPGGGPSGTGPDGFPGMPVGPFGEIAWSSVALAGVALFLSHAASFVLNYLGRGDDRRASPIGLLFSPYGRVVVLHLTILVGAFAIVILGAPIAALVVLVILKTILDLRLHLREQPSLRA